MAWYGPGNYYHKLLSARTAVNVAFTFSAWKIATTYPITHWLDKGLLLIYPIHKQFFIIYFSLGLVVFLSFHDLQDINEFKKLLKYFNDELGPAVCIYTIVNLSWAATGIVWLFQYYVNNVNYYPVTYVNVMNVVLWILISIVPFIQV